MEFPDDPPLATPAEAGHAARWRELFSAYCLLGGVEPTPARLDTVWGWIRSPTAQTRCAVAILAGQVVGFVHFRAFERPITASTGLWIDDLYVDPPSRGHGVAGALVGQVRATALREGCDVVRWTTKRTNTPARHLYDRIATEAPVAVYNATPTVA